MTLVVRRQTASELGEVLQSGAVEHDTKTGRWSTSHETSIVLQFAVKLRGDKFRGYRNGTFQFRVGCVSMAVYKTN